MKIFLDTANINEIKRINGIIQIDGVTTNPTLIAKEYLNDSKCEYVIDEIISEVHNNINVEIMSTTIDDVIKEITSLLNMLRSGINIKHRLIFKVPTTPDGLKIMKFLNEEYYKVNATLVFTSIQALLAAKAGAHYVSIFVGRLDDNFGIGSGMMAVEETLEIFKNYGIKAEVIVASIRNLGHINQSAMLGAHIVTVPPKLIDEMIYHTLTENGVKQFNIDWSIINDK